MDWKIHRAILIAAIWVAEVLSAGICGFIAALALIPASYAARGYFAFGGEWLIVLGVTLLAFHVINNAFFSECSSTTEKEVNHMAEQNLFCLCGRCSRKLRSAAARRAYGLDLLPQGDRQDHHPVAQGAGRAGGRSSGRAAGAGYTGIKEPRSKARPSCRTSLLYLAPHQKSTGA